MDVQSTGGCVVHGSLVVENSLVMINIRRTRENTTTSIWRPSERFIHQLAEYINPWTIGGPQN